MGRTATLLTDLAAQGRYHFTSAEAERIAGASRLAVLKALRRLRARGQVVMPFRGYFVILPPEYRRLGCLPADQFVPDFLTRKRVAHYVGLLSAAEIHGASHHAPQVFQVVVAKRRRRLTCGRLRVEFVLRKDAGKVPTEERHTDRGPFRVSTREATAFDLIGFPSHAGGLDNAVTVVSELAEGLDARRLAEAAGTASLPWAQRLGHVLDALGRADLTGPLAEYVAGRVREYVRLAPRAPARRSRRDSRWRIVANAPVEPEA